MRARDCAISPIMRLNVRARSVSSSEPVTGTRTERSPSATRLIAAESRLMRRVTPRARKMPSGDREDAA